jgi:hypothetical protein
MDVLFCRVDRLASEVVVHLLGSDACERRGKLPVSNACLVLTLVVDVGVFADKDTVRLTGDGL